MHAMQDAVNGYQSDFICNSKLNAIPTSIIQRKYLIKDTMANATDGGLSRRNESHRLNRVKQ
jgi:hypothetical protein